MKSVCKKTKTKKNSKNNENKTPNSAEELMVQVREIISNVVVVQNGAASGKRRGREKKAGNNFVL